MEYIEEKNMNDNNRLATLPVVDLYGENLLRKQKAQARRKDKQSRDKRKGERKRERWN